MSYREPISALEHKLRLLCEARRSIDASIAEATSELRELRRPPRRARLRIAGMTAAAGLVALLPVCAGLLSVNCLCSRRNREGAARGDAQLIHDAAWMYVAEHPDAPCPTMAQLYEAELFDPDRLLTDPWDKDFRIHCHGEEHITVTSDGPDRQQGTEDDISSDR